MWTWFHVFALREMVKTIALGQNPPSYKKTGGLFMYPPHPPKKKMVSCWYSPILSGVETEKSSQQ